MKNASDTFSALSQAYGEKFMEKASVFKWHKMFKEDRENMEDDERSCRTRSHRTSENVEKFRNLVHSDRQLSIRAMAVQLT
jgi:uncharacterized cysteine cluster protein YcgN (CxxCxxCC family)